MYLHNLTLVDILIMGVLVFVNTVLTMVLLPLLYLQYVSFVGVDFTFMLRRHVAESSPNIKAANDQAAHVVHVH